MLFCMCSVLLPLSTIHQNEFLCVLSVWENLIAGPGISLHTFFVNKKDYVKVWFLWMQQESNKKGKCLLLRPVFYNIYYSKTVWDSFQVILEVLFWLSTAFCCFFSCLCCFSYTQTRWCIRFLTPPLLAELQDLFMVHSLSPVTYCHT